MSVGGTVWDWIKGGISLFFGKFKMVVGTLSAKVLATLGLTMVSFQVLLPQLKAFVLQYVSGMPAEALNFLGYIGIGKAMSMVFSALTISLGSKMLILPKEVADNIGSGTP